MRVAVEGEPLVSGADPYTSLTFNVTVPAQATVVPQDSTTDTGMGGVIWDCARTGWDTIQANPADIIPMHIHAARAFRMPLLKVLMVAIYSSPFPIATEKRTSLANGYTSRLPRL